MRNPLAAHRRLGAALLALRTEAGWSHAELARRSGVSASVISRIENPFADPTRRPAIPAVQMLLDALGVEAGKRRGSIEHDAESAAARGWWDWPRYARMGTGQEWYAIVEAGAVTIAEYGGMGLPGLVQTPAYARARALSGAADVDPDAIVAGRLARQRILDDGVTYVLVIEEQAVRRHPVPEPVMREQLEHMLALMDRPTVDIQIVPVAARLGHGPGARAPFTHLTYPDGDPPIVIIDDVARAMLVTSDDDVTGYAQLHQRLCSAALPASDSAAVIREVADSLATAS